MEKQRISLGFADGGTFLKDMALYNLLGRNFPVELSDRPDFLFYHHAGHHHRLHSGVRIYHTSEADLLPDWNVCDYAMTPHYSDNPRHLRLPAYAMMFEAKTFLQSSGEAERTFAEKTKFCAFLSTYRNAKTKHRWDFFDKLSRHKRVDSAGKADNNVGAVVPLGVAPTVEFLRPYKFYLAFENKAVPGYIADRLLMGLAARCIPIYFGCPRVGEEFNSKRLLNYHDFPSEEALIERILEIDRDDNLFRQYLSEPVFNNNQPNPIFDPEYYLKYFRKIFSTPIETAAARDMKSWRKVFGRWTLAKRDRPHTPNWYRLDG